MKKILFFSCLLLLFGCIDTTLEEENSGLTIFPNPATDMFNILPENDGNIKVIGTEGDLLFEGFAIPGSMISIGISEQKPGLMYVEFGKNEKLFKEEIIKN